jgi:hypothetical protein
MAIQVIRDAVVDNKQHTKRTSAWIEINQSTLEQILHKNKQTSPFDINYDNVRRRSHHFHHYFRVGV